MANYMGLKSAHDLPYPISKCDHVKELIKALSKVKEIIGHSYFEEDGNNRNKRFRYIGKDDDPLADITTVPLKWTNRSLKSLK